MRKQSKQKIYGAALAALSILVAFWTGDATLGVLFVPLGLYLVFTKEYWLND